MILPGVYTVNIYCATALQTFFFVLNILGTITIPDHPNKYGRDPFPACHRLKQMRMSVDTKEKALGCHRRCLR